MHSPQSRLVEPAPTSQPSSATPRRIDSRPPAGARESLRFFVGLTLTSVIAAVFAISFRLALAFVLKEIGHATDVVSALVRAPVWARIVLPALGGLLAGTVSLLLRKRSDQGVGDVMDAVVLGRVTLSVRVTLIKSFASFCAIVCGGSLGREGPLIQLGAVGGKVASDWLRLSSRRRRVLIAAGTAAGFAAAYNTPFAAILFVLEIVLGVVVLEAIVPTVAATVFATLLTRAIVGPGPIYGVRSFTLHAPSELVSFFGLGLLCALAAQLFMRLISLGERSFKALGVGLPFRPALGGLGAGLFIAVVPEVAGNGYEPLNRLLDQRYGLVFVATLLVAKAFATTASVSSGNPGGIFTPTLLVGGAVGFLYFGLLERWLHLPLGQAGGYALVGMAAATAATTHAPLMAAVMSFELSGDYAIVLPLLLATSVATAVSRRLRRDSIYTAELRRRGVRWELTLEGRRVERDSSA